jgi:murein DD-endopeptidase MepM/ murein hydrolase activator NlpD
VTGGQGGGRGQGAGGSGCPREGGGPSEGRACQGPAACPGREERLVERLVHHARRSVARPGGERFHQFGYLTTPVRGAWVSSEFGMRFHPILHYWRLHAGIDFAASCGSPLYAADAGRVLSAGWGGGYGNRIVVDHGLIGDVGLATTYNHLSSIVVHGGSVRRGQLIGYSGTTGSSTGCHLHFETYENGVPVNPRRWL